MFSIKLTARPDARMVEVPLDIEAELPREFDGAAVLVSSGMPRKVRLRAPKDSIKLSTAYRLDQLIGDLVRTVLRGAQQDVVRVQDAAAQFVKLARERRQEGLTFIVESDGRGQIDVVEQAPPPAPNAFRGGVGTSSSGGLGGERLAALERGMAALEARLAAGPQADSIDRAVRALGEELGQQLGERLEQLERRQDQKFDPRIDQKIDHRLEQRMGQRSEPRADAKLEQRVAALEAQLAALQPPEPPTRTPERTAPHLPTPGAARAGLRRATAVEAFADGLRAELKIRVQGFLQRAEESAALCDAAARVAADAERSGGPRLAARAVLQQLAGEAGARTSALSRVADEIALYPAAEIPLAGQLVDRLGQIEPPDLIPHLRAIAEEGARAGTLQLGWLTRLAQLVGWKVIAPSPGDLYEPSLHELEGPRGDVIDELIMPGVHDKSGSMLLHARVRARRHDDEAGELSPAPGDPALAQGDLTLTQGGLTLAQDDLALTQGDLASAQGELAAAPDGSEPLAEGSPEAPEPNGEASLAAAELVSVEPLPEGETPGSDDGVISAQILDDPTGPALAEPLAEEPPIALPFLTEPFIPAPPDAGPLQAEPLVAAPIVSAPIQEEIISAPILEEIVPAPIVSAPIQEEIISAPILEEIVPAPTPPAPLEENPALLEENPAPLEEIPAPDDEWERVAKGPAAFISDEGRKRQEAAHAAEPPGGSEHS